MGQGRAPRAATGTGRHIIRKPPWRAVAVAWSFGEPRGLRLGSAAAPCSLFNLWTAALQT